MNDAVSRKAMLEFLHPLYKLNELSQAGKALDYVIKKLESGAFPSIPSPAEGRYREAFEQIIAAYEGEGSDIQVARKMVKIAREALSPSGEQNTVTPKYRMDREGNLHRIKEEDGE